MSRDIRRALGVLALLIVVAVAASAARHAPGYSGVGGHGAGSVAAALAVVVLLVGAALTIAGVVFVLRAARRRRRGDDEFELVHEQPPATFWQRAGELLALAVVAGLAVGLIVALARVHLAPRGRTATAPGPAAPAPVPRVAGHHTGANGVAIAVAVAAVLVVVVVAAFVLRARRRPAPDSSVGDESARTADVLRDAARALAGPADPRAAILACYATMERRLAAAGTERRSADTPEDLLDRATRSGLLLPGAAQRLADLFREARFSVHPMTAAHRADAEAALGTVLQAVRR